MKFSRIFSIPLVVMVFISILGSASAEEFAPSDFGSQGGFDLGLPQFSFADPEYVGEEKMTENLTAAYAWVSQNSTRFPEQCKTDKAVLVADLVGVIEGAQETSSVCVRLEEEASSCNPQTYCAGFSSGNLPLGPTERIAIKAAGYDPDTMKLEDFTQDVMIKICLAQATPEIEAQKQRVESAKAKIKEQLPNFKAQKVMGKADKALVIRADIGMIVPLLLRSAQTEPPLRVIAVDGSAGK